MNEFDAIKYSWDEETNAMKIEVIPMKDIYLTPEEENILRPEYEKCLQERYKWEWDDDAVLSFDDWWRAMADNVKSNRKGK